MDYEHLVQEALRSAVRKVLQETQKNGLKGRHHFYVSFATNYPGVDIPDFLRETNPEEVTIVLQHQFWDLVVEEKAFTVVLNFQEIPYKIRIPFDALLAFMDPGVKFGLQFVPPPISKPLPEESSILETSPVIDKEENNVITLDFFRKK